VKFNHAIQGQFSDLDVGLSQKMCFDPYCTECDIHKYEI